MDPITTAIMAVLPDLAADTLKDTVKSAYEGLKAVIRRKWGETAPISKAIKAAEEDPTSKAQAGVLAEKIEAVSATKDADVVRALHQLVEAMKETGVGAQATSAIKFNMTDGVIQDVRIAQNVTTGSMTFGAIQASESAIVAPTSNVTARDIRFGHVTEYHGPTAGQQLTMAELKRAGDILGHFDRLAVRAPMHSEAIEAMLWSLKDCRTSIAKMGANTIMDDQLQSLIDLLKGRVERICSIAEAAQDAVAQLGTSSLFYPTRSRSYGPSDPEISAQLSAMRAFVQGQQARGHLRHADPTDLQASAVQVNDFVVVYSFGLIDQIKLEMGRELTCSRKRLNELRLALSAGA